MNSRHLTSLLGRFSYSTFSFLCLEGSTFFTGFPTVMRSPEHHFYSKYERTRFYHFWCEEPSKRVTSVEGTTRTHPWPGGPTHACVDHQDSCSWGIRGRRQVLRQHPDFQSPRNASHGLQERTAHVLTSHRPSTPSTSPLNVSTE